MTSGKPAVLKIPYALSNDRLVHVSEVGGGLSHDCVCLECKAPLIARKGSKIRHHFAHHRATNCKPETVVHRIAKLLLAERINAALQSGQELPIQWKCARCDDPHPGNLLKLASTVNIERNFGLCRPDLALCKADGKPLVFIEIIVTHPPEENVLNFCRVERVELLEYRVRTEEDLEALANSSPLTFTRGSYCPRTRCSKCQKRLDSQKLHIVVAQCPLCKGNMKVAFASSERLLRGPDEFSSTEIATARKHGVVLQKQYSRTLDKEYVANVCSRPRCPGFIGKRFMPEYMDWKADAICWNPCIIEQHDGSDTDSRAAVDPNQLSMPGFDTL